MLNCWHRCKGWNALQNKRLIIEGELLKATLRLQPNKKLENTIIIHTIRCLDIRSDRCSRSGRPSASCSSFMSILCKLYRFYTSSSPSSSPCSEVLLRSPGLMMMILLLLFLQKQSLALIIARARAPTRRASVRPRAPCAAGPARGGGGRAPRLRPRLRPRARCAARAAAA